MLYGCLPTSYAEPELPLSSRLPDENYQMTIADIKSLYTKNPTVITDDVYCTATVVSNDLEGNFYKELYLQDSTGGLLLKVEFSNVSEKFGKGRTVNIKLQHLAFSIENNMPILGKLNGSKISALPITSIDSFIVRTNFYQHPVTTIIPSGLIPNNKLLGKLVMIEGVFFKEGGEKISETTVKSIQNFTLEFTNSPITVRVSPYCQFVESRLPLSTQPCHVEGVLSRYNNQWYLIISNFQDIVMIDP